MISTSKQVSLIESKLEKLYQDKKVVTSRVGEMLLDEQIDELESRLSYLRSMDVSTH